MLDLFGHSIAPAMNWSLSSVLAGVLLLSQASLAVPPARHDCQWVSEVTPDAVIRFKGTNRVGISTGSLFYKSRFLVGFQEGQFQGYGSRWWTTSGQTAAKGLLVVFEGNQVVRGTIDTSPRQRLKGHQRLLIVGLGSSLYYGLNQRQDQKLLSAAEGFWRPSVGCHDLN